LSERSLAGHQCFYAPDPSVFTCFYDNDTFTDDGQLDTPGACDETAAAQYDPIKDRYPASYADYFESTEKFRVSTIAIVGQAIMLEATAPQASCGESVDSYSTVEAPYRQSCAETCINDGKCAAFRWLATSCQLFDECEASDAVDLTGEFFRVTNNTGRHGNYSDQLIKWIGGMSKSSERELFGIYTDALYSLMNKDGYLKTSEVYPTRTCYGLAEQVGAVYTRAYRGSGTNCDEFTETKDWAYWKADNRPCTTLNNCFNVNPNDEISVNDRGVIAGGETGQTREGKNSLYPISQYTRREALAQSNTAYFISIIIVQWADLMICKTRTRSLFEQAMTNGFMNYALFFETMLGAFLVYIPQANIVMGTAPLRFVWWTSAIPFSIMIYIYDEVRKGYIRNHRANWMKSKAHKGEKYKGSWLTHNTFW